MRSLRPAVRQPLILALVWVGAVAAPAVPGAGRLAAQTIAGRVVDDATGAPLEGVHVVAFDSLGRRGAESFTDAEGRFQAAIDSAGPWHLSAELIGYASIRSDAVGVADGERVEVEIRMAVAAVPLEAVVVTARVRRNAEIEAFYRRMSRGKQTGFGRFVDRAEVERSGALRPTDLLRSMAGVRLVAGGPGRGNAIRMSGGCIPAVYVDGMLINRVYANDSMDDYLSTLSIEGIEVYRGAAAQVGRYYDPRGCGLILVWTRRGTHSDGPFSWPRLLIALAAIAALYLIR